MAKQPKNTNALEAPEAPEAPEAVYAVPARKLFATTVVEDEPKTSHPAELSAKTKAEMAAGLDALKSYQPPAEG